MSREVESAKLRSTEDVRSMLVAIAINSIQNAYNSEHKTLREEFFTLPLPEILKSWEWLSDESKVRVLKDNRLVFDAAVKEVLNGCSQ
jgi:hypothetical protein